MQVNQGAHLTGHFANALPYFLGAHARAPTWRHATKTLVVLGARAHVRKSLNVDFLTLDLEITAVLFLADHLTEK